MYVYVPQPQASKLYNADMLMMMMIYVKKLISLKHCVRSQITRLNLQKSFCDLEHGASL